MKLFYATGINKVILQAITRYFSIHRGYHAYGFVRDVNKYNKYLEGS